MMMESSFRLCRTGLLLYRPPMSTSRFPAFFAAFSGALLIWQFGCATSAVTLSIQQDHAPPSQKNMTLKSDWAFTARQDDRRLCLADCSLPGSVDGPRDFRLFVIFPGNVESAEVGRGPGSARGFFLQKVGRLRGKTEFASGSVKLSTGRLNRNQHEIDLDVECADGTKIIGKARLRVSDDELRIFLMQHAGDVAALDAATPGPTAKRGDGSIARPPQEEPKAEIAGEEIAERSDHSPAIKPAAEQP